MEAGESQVFVSIKMKQRTRMMQVSRNMEEGDEAWTGDSGEENAHKPVFLENESSDYTAVFGRLPESLRKAVAASCLYSTRRQPALAHTTYLNGGHVRQNWGKPMHGATRRAPAFLPGYPAPRRRGSGKAVGPRIGSLVSRCTCRTLFSLLCHFL